MSGGDKNGQGDLDLLVLGRDDVRTFRIALRQSVEVFSQDPDAGIKMMQIKTDGAERNFREAREQAIFQARIAHLRYRG